MAKSKNTVTTDYGEHTIDEMISILVHYRDKLGGDTLIHLSDFEFNGRQTQFEISQVDDEKELFLFYEMHEATWY